MADVPPQTQQSLSELKVKIVNAAGTLYNGPAASISSVNNTGPFDILPLHTNFISLIKVKVVLRLSDGTKREFALDDVGLLRNRANVVNIFLGFNLQ